MRNAFFDPVTRLLKCHGCVDANEPGDIALPAPDEFNFMPGEARLDVDGKTVQRYIPPPPPKRISVDALAAALKAKGLLSDADLTAAKR